ALQSNDLAVRDINTAAPNTLFPEFEIAQQLAEVHQLISGTWLVHGLLPALAGLQRRNRRPYHGHSSRWPTTSGAILAGRLESPLWSDFGKKALRLRRDHRATS